MRGFQTHGLPKSPWSGGTDDSLESPSRLGNDPRAGRIGISFGDDPAEDVANFDASLRNHVYIPLVLKTERVHPPKPVLPNGSVCHGKIQETDFLNAIPADVNEQQDGNFCLDACAVHTGNDI